MRQLYIIDGLDALGRDGQRDPTALRGDPEPLLLDVRIPATAGPAVRVRHVLAEARTFAADIAVRGHGVSPLNQVKLRVSQ